MTRLDASRTLLITCGLCVAIVGTVVLAETFSDAFGDDADYAWTWFLTIFTAPLTVVVASTFGEPSSRWKSALASPFRIRAAIFMMVLLTASALIILILEPYTVMRNFELMEVSLIPLTLIQGVTVAAFSAVVFEGR